MQYLNAILANPQLVAAVVAISGVLIGIMGVASGWVLALINRRHEDRRQVRQIAFEAAVENWKHDYELGKLLQERTHKTIRFHPLDTYLVHMMQVADLVLSKRLTMENIEAELIRIRGITNEAKKAASKKYPSE